MKCSPIALEMARSLSRDRWPSAPRVAQEKLGLKLITVHLQPAVLRSFVAPPMLGPYAFPRWLPAWCVRGYFGLLDRLIVDRIVGPTIVPLRRELGLPEAQSYFGDLVEFAPACACAFSGVVCARA